MSIAEKLTAIAENLPKVYEAAVKVGEKSGQDSFWDTFQKNGTTGAERTDYQYAFYGRSWVDSIFTPTHDIKPTTSKYMFAYNNLTNLRELLEKANVVLDTSNSSDVQQMFMNCSSLTEVPTISTIKASYLTQMFSSCSKLVKVSLILKDTGTQTFQNTFNSCSALKELYILGGVIEAAFSVSSASGLISASIDSIIDHLADLTGKTALKISWHSIVLKNLTEEQKAKMDSKNWLYE